jgi:hypothetical protein
MKPVVSRSRSRNASAVLTVLACASLACALLIYKATGFLRLSGDAQALRNSLTGSADSGWAKRFEGSIGPITTGLIRAGSSFVELEPEIRAALEAVRRVEVGVYQLTQGESIDPATMLRGADEAMAQLGWDRLAGVLQGGQMVAVYVPAGEVSARNVRVCVAVLTRHELVVVSTRSNLEPLLQLALARVNCHSQDWLPIRHGG